ncbi:hypothetical protein MNBD_NITROSPINAE03-2051 [hydrothermal vent metagenome]|uniref:Phage virion morphogenesis protein n=1 Tax=hydrothermal vent metagenome TaxID=652676 RepID=A0A3B1BX44_9ZZZZ
MATINATAGGALLQQERERLNDISPALFSFARPLYDSIIENFYSGGRPPWAPLSPGYLKRKTESGYPPDILIRTGALLNSIKVTPDGGRVTATAGVEYAAALQYGTGNIPPRPFLMLQPEDETELSRLVVEYIAGVS